MQRAIRAARAVLHGQRILETMREEETRRLLIGAVEAGQPPVSAISQVLKEKIGLKDAKLMPVKQFAGLCIRAVLEEEGYEVAQAGVRLSNDPIFRTGAVYKKSAAQSAVGHELLRRFLATLTDEEAAVAHDILADRGLKHKRLRNESEKE
jgi:hypothetical protein